MISGVCWATSPGLMSLLNKVEVTKGEQGKRIKMEEETKKIGQLLATHLGSAEVVGQSRLDQ